MSHPTRGEALSSVPWRPGLAGLAARRLADPHLCNSRASDAVR